MARRREFNVISMSFLDAMTCGFGAVILFFMIITANIDLRRDTVLDDVAAEVDRMEIRVVAGRRNLVQIREDLARLLEDRFTTRGVKQQIMAEIETTREDLVTQAEAADTRDDLIEQLRADLAALEEETEQLALTDDTAEEAGASIRSVQGEGYRQYLTGLRMGGQRIVILVDVSASMLDRTLVNIIRRRNLPDVQKRQAPKWQQLVNTVDWLTAQIPPGTQFQVIAFNDEAWSLVEGTDGQWLTASDASQLDEAVRRLREETVAEGPTSLHSAFQAARRLEPRPDNIYLLVDGLPTMGGVQPTRNGVTSRERLGHFERASRERPIGTPVNVILLAMEGDPLAAPAYWQLALESGGSMMAPAEDWP